MSDLREESCELETQEGRKIYLARRIEMAQIRRCSRLEAITRGGDYSDEAFENLYQAYAEMLPRWDFLDPKAAEPGTPLPQPEDDPWVFDRLTPEEFVWVTQTIFGSMKANPPTA